jgi:hypothetical protein
MKLDKMCTSVAIGFYIRNKASFLDFKTKILKMSRESDSIFSVYEEKPAKHTLDVPTGVIQTVKISSGKGED